MADSDNESYDSSSPRSSSYDDWTKEPLVGEKLCVYLLHWDKATQDLPDIFDTTLIKPKDPTTIYRCVSECVIHYHSTTLTRAQFELEYGMPPRSRDEEIMRLRHAMLAQYLTEVEMDRKKRHALNQDDMHEVDETAALRTADMSPLDRLKYVTSLWPTNMPNFPDTEDSLNYYGFQVGIYIDTNDETKDETSAASTHNQDETTKAADPNENDHDTIDTPLDDAHQPEANSSKQPLMKAAPAAPVKEENWVQCDKCQKWRKLPDSVDVSALPTTWYCRMNKWSRKFNKCSAVEETTTAPAASHGGSDMHSIRERKFVHQFAQRLKRMEKALGELKYADMKEDLGERQHVSCVECGKKRPLLGGMDPIKVPQVTTTSRRCGVGRRLVICRSRLCVG
ncbi:hypothetical protein, variant 1 [Aphanomyces astaci]|uniref:CW-type domain-containing protein n=1 Tax=Aphanomyces astaci TaxID=112090 RepID=W4FKP8_APHAT|nr:hypothetical protein, variant 1 [Aphanomyces astaci]ETV68052.1 hypothetical protein, variant 1 [Aphanomyces astaci]|eukprot:XP_009842352.1 hypothetical protein, variant 1 [Aphanomyces astaci]